MRRTGIALSLILTLALAACGGGASGGGGGGTEVPVGLSDFKFTPASVEIPANTKVVLKLKNTGTVEHDFVVEKLGVKITVPRDAKEHEYSVGPLAAGTYDLVCTVVGHKELGMTGKLVVK